MEPESCGARDAKLVGHLGRFHAKLEQLLQRLPLLAFFEGFVGPLGLIVAGLQSGLEGFDRIAKRAARFLERDLEPCAFIRPVIVRAL